jgi:hypothetical protein
MRTDELRSAIAAHVLPEIPKLLTLLDRTAASRTYGCFDRTYWHYRMIDFPCGMSQEFVLPLALVWSTPDLPGNPYFRSDAIREWILAGIRYAARSSHPDGSCDDYYPFERAAGAAAFSLFAILETLDIVELGPDPEVDGFVLKRARWLAAHRESGRLSNHEALIASCLERAGRRFPEAGLERAMRDRLARLLSWQDEEGWFDEYGGADLGYLSLTIGLLADLDRRRPDLNLRPPLGRAIDFFAHFVHPDGTVGGEYSSRSTLNFFAFGFEIAGDWHPSARAIDDLALRPMLEGRSPCYSDDRIVGHHLWGWMLTLRHYRERQPAPLELSAGRRYFPRCGLLVERDAETLLVANLKRGGVYKHFSGGRLGRSDTGVTLRTKDGRAAVAHLGGSVATVGPDEIRCEGAMGWAKSSRLTPAKNVALRVLMLGLGRFFPDLVRRLLQRILVTGSSEAPFRCVRTFRRTGNGGWTVRDEVRASSGGGWDDVELAGISGHQTSITTIMARVYQADQLAPFEDLSVELAKAKADGVLVHERRLARGVPCES